MPVLHVSAQQVTWSQHIAPVIHRNCTPCHRPGDAAPFSLITYEDVAKRANFIKRVTESRYMPPWKPDPHYVSFANERRLTAEEIRLIGEWAESGMSKGDAPVKEEPPVTTTGTLNNRQPDLVVKMKTAYTLKGDNVERFIVYKLPFELPDSMAVEAIEFVSSNRKVIHHANYEINDVPHADFDNTADYVDNTESHLDYYQQYINYRKKMKYFGGWIPGSSYESYPEDIGWMMPKRGVVLLTVHYAPVGKDEEVISGVQFYFRKKLIKRIINATTYGSGGVGEKDIEPFFYIPANVEKSFKLKVKLTETQSLLYVWPHMHLLGKSFKAYAVTPAKDTIRLVSVPQWDFNWQEIYWFPKMVKLPKGAVLMMEGEYDNTVNNASNPSFPPQLVYGAMRTKDEMLTMIMMTLSYEEGDEGRDLKRP
ncbi:cytochrome c [Chitinophaga sp. B61]|uniref:Cytochrome c n=2 Tax=Chitinophaga rhizophila TaxID=2866212 RepID=A0ABS7GB51_9BACT|nr:cytochrome c [Chitinophaga rhizophila]MBW8684044.1 cytochrome c [Chitinophaga rhizophila]